MDSLEEGCANRHTKSTRQESCGPGGLLGLGGVIVGWKIAKSSSHRVVLAERGVGGVRALCVLWLVFSFPNPMREVELLPHFTGEMERVGPAHLGARPEHLVEGSPSRAPDSLRQSRETGSSGSLLQTGRLRTELHGPQRHRHTGVGGSEPGRFLHPLRPCACLPATLLVLTCPHVLTSVSSGAQPWVNICLRADGSVCHQYFWAAGGRGQVELGASLP